MKIIHLTDPHLTVPGQTIYGLDPLERFRAAIADINEHHADAAFCVITGDLAHTADEQAYAALRETLQDLLIPCELVMGNHDDRDRLCAAFPELARDENGFIQRQLPSEAGTCIILDTVQPGTHQGAYCERRRQWLKEQLDQAPDDQPAYLFMHHNPFLVGIQAMDAIALQQDDARALGDLLTDYGYIRHIFFGHVHRPIHGSWRGIPFSTLRGTNHQVWLDFSPSDTIPGSHEPPAYAVVFLEEDRVVIHTHDFLDSSPKYKLGSWRWDEWHKVDAKGMQV